ncbi:MAG: ribosome biogenesis GTPase Der [Planctomycetota bacterium]|jgi:GTP-binding protein
MPPLVAIIGRPNVGKSSLFNSLIRRRVAIVEPTPGITRDRLTAEVSEGDRRFTLVDTGGIGIVDRADLASEVENQVRTAIGEADVLVFLVDIQEGPTPLDERVAALLRATGKPVLVAANKADHEGLDDQAVDFYRLGFGEPFPVSAQQRRNLADLLEQVEATLPPDPEEDAAADPVMKVCVVGRRNAGKSTLINALAGDQRVIVSEHPGTTRDAVDVHITRGEKRFVLVDTAGIRRRTRIQNSVEFYSQARAEQSIRRSDVAILLLDATVEIGAIDKRIAAYVARHYKACILGINKWDRVPEDVETERFIKYIRDRLRGPGYAPIAFLSALEGVNVEGTFQLAQDLFEQMCQRASTADVNRILQEAVEKRTPPPKRGRLPKFYFGTQTGIVPPTIVLFVNNPAGLGKDYVRYLENRFRASLPFEEVPVRLVLRGRGGEAGR